MIYLSIYFFIISLIIYRSLKFLFITKNFKNFNESLNLFSLPFYQNRGSINTIAFLLSFFFFILLSISEQFGSIAYCQDSNRLSFIFENESLISLSSLSVSSSNDIGSDSDDSIDSDFSSDSNNGSTNPSSLLLDLVENCQILVDRNVNSNPSNFMASRFDLFNLIEVYDVNLFINKAVAEHEIIFNNYNQIFSNFNYNQDEIIRSRDFIDILSSFKEIHIWNFEISLKSFFNLSKFNHLRPEIVSFVEQELFIGREIPFEVQLYILEYTNFDTFLINFKLFFIKMLVAEQAINQNLDVLNSLNPEQVMSELEIGVISMDNDTDTCLVTDFNAYFSKLKNSTVFNNTQICPGNTLQETPLTVYDLKNANVSTLNQYCSRIFISKNKNIEVDNFPFFNNYREHLNENFNRNHGIRWRNDTN